MKKSSVDLIVGGSILIALFILIAGVLWLKEISITRKMTEYGVLFPNIGSLAAGDAVYVSGVKKGTAGKIFLHGTKVAIILKLDRDIPLTDSSRITVQNIGLMGERIIGIQLSEKGTRCKPFSKRDKNYPWITGYFDSGIAEAMGLLGTVLADVQALVDNVQTIVDNTVGDTSFVIFYNTTIARLDTVTRLVESLLKQNKSKVNRSISDVNAITADVRRLLADNQSSINQVVSNGKDLTDRALQIAAEIETVSVSLGGIVNSLEKGEGSLGMLMKDEQFYNDLKKTVARLDNLVTDVNDKGLKLRIKLGFRNEKKSR